MSTTTNPTATQVGGPATYFIRAGYRSRECVEYFVDETTDAVWQPDVYPYTADQALARGHDAIIDIGCGRAGKLLSLSTTHPTWAYIGVDFGENLTWCRDNLPFGTWIHADLETTQHLPIASHLLERSVVVCSDVLEHLLNPVPALTMIHGLLKGGAAVAVLSTPARERRSGYSDPGPPRNPSHVREWASDEFQSLLEFAGFRILHAGLTRSDDISGGMTTQLVLVDLRPE
ncbi:MAG: class I SAM-dependent methyltransferase [Micromonosporaceae bacterium]